MTLSEYKRRVETELINEFVRKFTDKVGYSPIVITEKGSSELDYKVISLQELEDCFERYLPIYNNRKIGLRHKCRIKEIIELRHTFCFIARLMRYNYTSIGRYLNRDHTTIINSIKTFRNLYETEESFKNLYINILNIIKDKYESPIMENFDKI